MDLMVACGAIGAVFGVAVGAAASFSREQKVATQHILARYEHARNDRNMAEKLLQLHVFEECAPDLFTQVCEGCDQLASVHHLALLSGVDNSAKFQYIWRFKAYQYKKQIYQAMAELSRAVFEWNAGQLARRANGGTGGQDQQQQQHYPAGGPRKQSAVADAKSKADFARCAKELSTIVEDYYNNLMLQQ